LSFRGLQLRPFNWHKAKAARSWDFLIVQNHLSSSPSFRPESGEAARRGGLRGSWKQARFRDWNPAGGEGRVLSMARVKLSCVSPISDNGDPTAKFPGSILKINPPVLPRPAPRSLSRVKAAELFKSRASRGCPSHRSRPPRAGTPRVPPASM